MVGLALTSLPIPLGLSIRAASLCLTSSAADVCERAQNPSRPMEPHERKIFEDNDWKLITASQVLI